MEEDNNNNNNNNNNNINNGQEEEEEGSCSSRALSLSLGSTTLVNNNNRKKRKQKVEVYEQVRRRLKELGNPEADQPGFDDELWAHFNRLSVRYALDVNVERAEDVIVHKKLLRTARDPNTRIAFTVRLLQVHPICDENSGDFLPSNFTEKGDPKTSEYVVRHSIHPPPAFVLSPSLDLALEARISQFPEGSSSMNPNLQSRKYERSLHEITISTLDKPKLLSQLTSLLSEIGLNIQEAHAFSTVDGYSLDVFIVDGWKYEETERLRSVLENEIPNIERKSRLENYIYGDSGYSRIMAMPDQVNIPMDGTDVWEIDSKILVFKHKIASGSFGDLYKGTLHSQDVAIKCLKAHYLNAGVQKEFAQEIYILRKVRHKNVVQFIGACTRPPNLYIVTEFMAGGSVYDFLHKQKGFFKFPAILKVAIDVSKGMNYLHQNNIIHRDLKAANILMDDNEVVKVADFGVARVQTQSGVMTAETGTYRWMAPEVIEHRPYDHKADVFSFGIVLWELLTGKLPYEDVTPLQAAVGVVQKGLRPSIPIDTHPKIAELLERCWQQDPSVRPDFSEIILILENIAQTVAEEERPGKRRNQVQREMN